MCVCVCNASNAIRYDRVLIFIFIVWPNLSLLLSIKFVKFKIEFCFVNHQHLPLPQDSNRVNETMIKLKEV